MRRAAQWLFVNCILVLALWSAQSAWSDDGISPFGKAYGATFGFNTTASFGKASLSYTSQSVDKGFTRLYDLANDDKNAIALSILRQFNPNATEKQITDSDRNRIAQEAGLDRSNLSLSFAPGKNSTLAIQTLSIGDDNGSVSRRQISFTGKNAKFYFMTQDIDKDFRAIASLADVERNAFGNEVGMHRMNFGGSFNAGSLAAEFASSRVEDGSAAISRRSLGFTGKSFKLKADFTDIDQNFSRISDLADPDRSILEQFRGYKKTDLTGSFNFAKNLSLDAFYMTAHNATEERDLNQLRTSLAYTGPGGLKLVWFRDTYGDQSATGTLAGYAHQRFAIERKLGAFGFASADQDVCETTQLDGTTVNAIVRNYHFGTQKNRRISFVYDSKDQDFGTGKFENLTDYAIGYKVSASLSFKSILHQIDRGADPSETVRTNLLQWQIRKRLSFSAEKTDRATNNGNDGGITKLSLITPVTDKLGPLTNVKVGAQYYSEDTKGVPQKGSESLKIEANALKGNMTAEYAGARSAPNSSFAGCGFSFISDRNEKKRYHFNLGFKNREIASGNQVRALSYGLDAKLSRKTFLVYSLKSYDDQTSGMDQAVAEELKLTSALGKKINFICGFKKRQDYILRTGTYLMDAGLSGTLPSGAAFEMSFGINSSTDAIGFRSGRTCRIKYDHKVSANNYLSLETTITKWSGVLLPGQLRTDCLARLDFKRVFSL